MPVSVPLSLAAFYGNTVVTSTSLGPATVQFLRQEQSDAHLKQALQLPPKKSRE